MTKKIIGTILLIASVVLSVVLFMNGRFIFPHVIGPGSLALIGVSLLALKSKTNKSTE